MRKILLILCVGLIGCGPSYLVNGVKIPVKQKENRAKDIFLAVSCFGLGYYLGNEVIPKSNK